MCPLKTKWLCDEQFLYRRLYIEHDKHCSVHTVCIFAWSYHCSHCEINTIGLCSNKKWCVWTSCSATTLSFQYQNSSPTTQSDGFTTLPYILIYSWSHQQGPPQWISVSKHYISWHLWLSSHDTYSLYSELLHIPHWRALHKLYNSVLLFYLCSIFMFLIAAVIIVAFFLYTKQNEV